MICSIVLESFNKKEFLTFVKAIAEYSETDVLFSGEGYNGEDKSSCFIMPSESFEITQETKLDDVRKFIYMDDREVLGFLSYDYGLELKGITSDKERDIELGLLKKYLVYARHENNKLTIESDSPEIIDSIIEAYECYEIKDDNLESCDVSCNMTAAEYESKVAEIIEYIRDGQTYQLNLSMMFETEMEVEPMELWAKMAESHPAPFYAFINSLEGEIISTSPERFLRVEDGHVKSQPIKGTYRFSEYTPELDKMLTDSRKETAELSMIVDLIRNDISESCEVGSVKVDNHKYIMKVDNLLQMYSDVSGELNSDKDVIDLLFSAFPGGSVTGCPKKRSMELIEQLEPHARGIYCGSIFTIKDSKNMDSSIAIRTGFCKDEELKFFAGSGIVADSEPHKEYLESVSKAEKFLESFK